MHDHKCRGGQNFDKSVPDPKYLTYPNFVCFPFHAIDKIILNNIPLRNGNGSSRVSVRSKYWNDIEKSKRIDYLSIDHT